MKTIGYSLKKSNTSQIIYKANLNKLCSQVFHLLKGLCLGFITL